MILKNFLSFSSLKMAFVHFSVQSARNHYVTRSQLSFFSNGKPSILLFSSAALLHLGHFEMSFLICVLKQNPSKILYLGKYIYKLPTVQAQSIIFPWECIKTILRIWLVPNLTQFIPTLNVMQCNLITFAPMNLIFC